MLLEDAGALADLGDRRVPVAALADGELQRVLRERGAASASASAASSDELPSELPFIEFLRRLRCLPASRRQSADVDCRALAVRRGSRRNARWRAPAAPSVVQSVPFGTMPSNDRSVTCGTAAGRADRRLAVRVAAHRLDHHAAELDDRDVARAEPLGRRSAIGPIVSHIAMSCFGMPRMPVKSPSFIACAVLQVVVVAIAPVAEVRVEIDAGLRAAELAPRLLVDAAVPRSLHAMK